MTFDIALSGLNAASKDLEVISNNIANNATTGYKASRIEFSDVYSASKQNSAGQGVSIANISQDHSAGSTTDTGKKLDLSITGQGFFRMDNNGDVSYTRNGIFSLDRSGFIINSAQEQLTGHSTTADGVLSPTVGPLQIQADDIPPNPTTTLEFGINLDATMEVLNPFDVDNPDTYNFSTGTTMYDSLGNPNILTLYFHKDTPNTWSMFSYVDGNEVSQAGGDELVFDTDGQLTSVNGAASSLHDVPAFLPTTGAGPMDVDFDLTNLTQYSGNFGVNSILQDGFANGRLNDLDIDEEGSIMGRYSNGQTQQLGQVTLTNFRNVDGLEQTNGTSWKETYASGSALTGKPGSAALGSIRGGSLEESNVEITEELVSMISAQRSFQANAQVITTSDTINQTVINMRR